jgi:hypothetical protein
MTFSFYYRIKPGDNTTKAGKGEANSLADAEKLALNAIKAKYPDGVLLDVLDSSEAVELADLDTIYATFYSLPKGCSDIKPGQGRIQCGRTVAATREKAWELTKEALNAKYPGWQDLKIVLAKNCPIPVINARGMNCDPSLVY